MEKWLDIIGFEGLYQVSNYGRVYSCKRGKILIPYIRNGYWSIALWKNGVSKKMHIHRIVSVNFLGDSKLDVDHINGIKTDNRVENLRYLSHRQNITEHTIKTNKSSKYTGVYYIKSRKKYKSFICVNKKQEYLGLYDTEIEASIAYQNRLKSLQP